MKSAWRLLGGIVVLFVIALVFLQGSSESSTAVTAQERSFSVSEPVTPQLSVAVRELPTGDAQPLLDREINPLRNPHFLSEGMGLKGSNTIGLDPLAELSRTQETGNTPDTLFTFDGLGSDGFTPPDTVGDVGPNHYIQMVNVSFQIWEKNANPDLPPTIVQPDTAFNQLFTGAGGLCESNNDGDPIVVYDELADRWLLSQFADIFGSMTMCIAISQTPDPTGTYYLYELPGMPDVPDYFKFGVWPDGYYMSTNSGAPNQYYAHVFDRESMLAGEPATFQSFGGYPNFMMPSDLDGNTAPPAGSPNYFYTFFDSDYPDHPAGTDDRLALYEFDVDWDTPTNSIFALVQEIPVAAYNYTVCGFFAQNCIPQPGTTQTIDSLSYWPMFRFAYRNQGSHEAMVGNFTVDLDGTDKAAIRWFELRKAGAADWALHQEGTHAPDDDHRWMGSIAMDSSGNIALGYSVSSSTTFPSIRYATRLEGDPLGTLQAESSMLEGGGSQTSVVRWGDYSAMSIDPADGCTFWYTTEYHPANDDGFNWHTAIGTFRLDSCGTADFTLNASPPTQDVCAPDESMFNVNVGQVQDYDDEVALSANNLPGQISATFKPDTLTPSTPPATSMLTIGNTASVAAGSYSVEIMGMALTSTHTTTIGINIFDSIPLAATLIAPADGAIDASLVPTFEWTAPDQGTDYYLEVASDMEFGTIVYTAMVDSTSHQMSTALSPLTTYHWRVRADNLCGEGAVSEVLSFTTADIPPILLVDDQNGDSDERGSYTDSLDALGVDYDVWDTTVDGGDPTAQNLAPYQIIIWFTGSDFGSTAGPNENELSTYIDNTPGACLFLSSQDYLWGQGGSGSDTLTNFMTTYLGASEGDSDVTQTTVTGAGDFSDLGPYSLSYPFTNYSDRLEADGTASVVFTGNQGNAAISKVTDAYRTTWWGFPFETISSAAEREEAMATILDWCGSSPTTGTLEGTVTDADSGDGIEGATITADDGSTQRTATTDENGEYTVSLPAGTYDVMADADMYMSEMMSEVVVMTDTTTTADFMLQGSSLSYSPTEIEENMELGDMIATTVTVMASGPLDVDFSVSIENFNNEVNDWVYAVPDSGTVSANGTMSFDVIFDATSFMELGTYTAELSFNGTFVNEVDVMPLTMNLSCSTCALLEGDITNAFTADPLSANINVMGDGIDMNVTGDSYSLAVPAGDYDVTVSANDYFEESATVTAVAGETTVTDFALIPMIALLDYMPDNLEQTLVIGEMASQELVIQNDGTIAFDFTVSDDAPWLEQEPMMGTIAAGESMIIDIIFDATDITEAGTYTGMISIDGTFDNEGAQIPVVMHVEEPNTEMSLELEFPEIKIALDQQMSQILSLSNTGNVAFDWEAFTEEGSARLVAGGECSGNNTELTWMTFDSTSGTVPAGETHDIEVIADSTGLEAADYEGNICITLPANDQTVRIPVTLRVIVPTAVDMAELNASNTSHTLPLGLLAAGMLLLVAGGYVAKRRRE